MFVSTLRRFLSMALVTRSLAQSLAKESVELPGGNLLSYCNDDPDDYVVRINQVNTDDPLISAENTMFTVDATALYEPFQEGDKLKITLKRHLVPYKFSIDICKKEGVDCPTHNLYLEHEHYMSPIMRKGKIHVEAKIVRDRETLVCARGKYQIAVDWGKWGEGGNVWESDDQQRGKV